jgi:hypothetical protein
MATAFTGHPVMPTVTIRDLVANLAGLRGEAIVPRRLTGAAFDGTVLERFGGAQTIGAHGAGYHVVTPATDPPPAPHPFGDLDGRLVIHLDVAPAAAGTYRGLVLVREAGAPRFEPMAWLVVVAE